MSVSVTMPRLGESVTEGTVTRWLKSEGDHVDADEPLLEVSTDKVDTEVPSPASGAAARAAAVPAAAACAAGAAERAAVCRPAVRVPAVRRPALRSPAGVGTRPSRAAP